MADVTRDDLDRAIRRHKEGCEGPLRELAEAVGKLADEVGGAKTEIAVFHGKLYGLSPTDKGDIGEMKESISCARDLKTKVARLEVVAKGGGAAGVLASIAAGAAKLAGVY